MTEESKPTFLLVHGGWSGAWIWDQLVTELESRGFRSIAIDLPGCVHAKSFGWRLKLDLYVEEIAGAARGLKAPVYVVAHSAGGIPVSQAVANAPECFEKVVYVSAYLPKTGESLASLAAQDQSSDLKSSIKPDFVRGTLRQEPEAIAQSSYHDCDPTWVAQNISRHRPEPIRPGGTKVQLSEGFESIEKIYIRCTDDRAISVEFQNWMISRYNLTSVLDIATGHMPMVAAANDLAELLEQIASSR